jgi:glycosyltransferase involved in cell wall biosynthesis
MTTVGLTNINTNNGGAAIAVLRLYKGLSCQRDDGMKYTIITMGGEGRVEEYEKAVEKWWSPYRILGMENNNTLLLRYMVNVLWRKALLRKNGMREFYRSGNSIDVSKTFRRVEIISLFWHGLMLRSCELIKLGKPVVITLHDMWPLTGGCAYSMDCSDYAKGCVNCPDATNSAAAAIIRRQFAKKHEILKSPSTHIVTTSKWMGQNLAECKIDQARIHKINNYIPPNYTYLGDKAIARRVIYGTDDAHRCRTVLYFIGSINDTRKGFRLFIQALDLLPQRYREHLHIQILGVANIKIQSLEELRMSYVSLGHYRDEASQIMAYNAADYLVVPSISDNSPNVIAEAHKCGLPTIAFENTGVTEMVRHGYNGYIAKYPYISNLSKIFTSIIAAPQDLDRESIAQNAEREYGFQNTCQKYINLYKSLRA